MNLTVGVIGLGNIGNGVAKNIAKKGYKVLGFDIDPNRMDECISISVNSIEEIAFQSHFLLVAVATLEAYEEVMKIISINASDKLIVGDLCTFSEKTKKQTYLTLAENGIVLIDCPVSGARPQSQAGKLSMTVSGKKPAFDKVETILNSFCRSVIYVGEFGVSIKIKYILNLMIAIHNLTCAEAFVMAEKVGVDLELFVKVVKNSKETFYSSSSGFADITNNKVEILVETIELSKEIDQSRAQNSINRAKKRLNDRKMDQTRSILSLQKALNRLKVSKR